MNASASRIPEPQRILVVDDEPSIVDAVATALRYEGYDVEEAATGREALKSVANREPDLIVLDWMLPHLEGIEVGRRPRAQASRVPSSSSPPRTAPSTRSRRYAPAATTT